MARVVPFHQIFSVVSFALILVTTHSVAQQEKVLAPHRPVEPRIQHPIPLPRPLSSRSMRGGFWMTDANFKSSIYLKNDLLTDPLTVTPILYLSNGRRLTLPQVKLEASSTAVVSINDALQQQNIAPWATLFGYVEVEYRWPWDALCVTIRNLDVVHSLIFMYYLEGSGSPHPRSRNVLADLQPNILEGLWWKQENGVTGFISLSNTQSQPVHAKVQVSNAAAEPIAEHSVTVSPHGTKVVDLTELGTAPTSQGGVRITWDGEDKGLIVNGALRDESVGYSARLPLHFPPVASAPSTHLTHAAVGLMNGAADPMMSFPAGTTFTPYAVARNISDQPMTVTPTLWWMEGSVPHSAKLPPFTLSAYRTQNLDMPTLISQAGLKNFNGSLNLALEADGRARALLIGTGNVDQKNTYVFEVLASGVMESVAKSISYWSTRDGDDTMTTLWNPADEAQDFIFTLFFSGGHYRLPIHLDARATRMFNVSEIIHSQIPDDEGNVVPATVHEGSAEIAGSKGENQHILIAMDAATYNVQKATCGTFCGTCQGAVNGFVLDNPFGVAVNDNHQLTFTVQYHNGAQYNHTTSATWTSSNTSIASVSVGLVNGVNPGAVSMDAFDGNVPDFWSGCLGANPDGFCQNFGMDGNSPGLAFTPVQHNYPGNPLSLACRISQFFDRIGNAGTSHKAEDVVYNGGNTSLGTPVYAMEAGSVVKIVNTAGPASVGFPQCQGRGFPGNRVNVRGADGFITVYYHVMPLPGITVGTQVTQGQQIGTLDNSGCQSAPHLHVGRLGPNGPVNFTIPCVNPLPTTNFGDGVIDDDDTDVP